MHGSCYNKRQSAGLVDWFTSKERAMTGNGGARYGLNWHEDKTSQGHGAVCQYCLHNKPHFEGIYSNSFLFWLLLILKLRLWNKVLVAYGYALLILKIYINARIVRVITDLSNFWTCSFFLHNWVVASHHVVRKIKANSLMCTIASKINVTPTKLYHIVRKTAALCKCSFLSNKIDLCY